MISLDHKRAKKSRKKALQGFVFGLGCVYRNKGDMEMKAGFDLTDISKEKWEIMLDVFGLQQMDHPKGYWKWANNKVEVVTANDPISGFPYDYDQNSCFRDIEEGYASYIGIEGDPSLVAQIFSYIKENADEIKDEEFGHRSFI